MSAEEDVRVRVRVRARVRVREWGTPVAGVRHQALQKCNGRC